MTGPHDLSSPNATPSHWRWAPATLTFVAVIAWLGFVLIVARAHYGGDLRAFIVPGSRMPHPAVFAGIPADSPGGYDGQYYAALATDPLLHRDETLRALDMPSYRATRILVPFLAWLAAVGRPSASILAYEFLCWGLGIAGILVIAHWLVETHRSPWWAGLLVLNAGLVASITRATPDAAAMTLVAAALLSHARGRPRSAVGLLAAAVLARETSIIAALALAWEETHKRRWMSAAAFAALPIAALLAIQLWLGHRIGVSFNRGAFNFGPMLA